MALTKERGTPSDRRHISHVCGSAALQRGVVRPGAEFGGNRAEQAEFSGRGCIALLQTSCLGFWLVIPMHL